MIDGVRHKSALTHPKLVVDHYCQTAARVRKMYVVQGIASDNRTLRVDDPDIDTLACALLERMYYCKINGEFVAPPVTDRKHIFHCLAAFRGKLLHKFGCSPSRISPEEFSQMYTGRKRTIYTNAVADYYVYGVTRRDSISNAFVKCGKVNPTKAPRCIQPRKPVYNVAVGTFLKHIEHRLYRSVQSTFGSGTPIVLKGLNASEIATTIVQKWEGFANPVAVGLDAVKFDMHVSENMLAWEHSIYQALYSNDPELKRLLRWQRKNKGRGYCADGRLRYSVEGRRFSGDMNTALGNCLIMCAMIYSYAHDRNIAIDLANNGDDCVVFMDKADLKKFSVGLNEWFYAMGFRMTVEPPAYRLEEIEFCQMRPINLGNEYVMSRDYLIAREKDSICLFDITSEGAYRKWMGAVGECGLAIAGGLPVFQAMYSAYCRAGKPGNVLNSLQMQSGFLMLSRGMESKRRPVSETARFSFFLAYDVTPDEQLALEQYYDELDLTCFNSEWVDSLSDIYAAPL